MPPAVETGVHLDLEIRAIEVDEIPQAARLVVLVFQQSVAPLYVAEGVKEFMAYASPEALSRRLGGDHVAFVATKAPGRVVGVVEVRDHRHVSLLFVDRALQRRGIGRRLLLKAIEACREANPEVKALTVNASPNSVGAYERLGFESTGGEQERNGIRFVPMSLILGEVGGD